LIPIAPLKALLISRLCFSAEILGQPWLNVSVASE
jgi:hypothetical protein